MQLDWLFYVAYLFVSSGVIFYIKLPLVSTTTDLLDK
jgi:hypothetical protein